MLLPRRHYLTKYEPVEEAILTEQAGINAGDDVCGFRQGSVGDPWDELDLRHVDGKDAQIAAIRVGQVLECQGEGGPSDRYGKPYLSDG